MLEQEQSLLEIQHIRNMMERSSRFISLSGLSGIAAGVCALIGAWFANQVISGHGGPSAFTHGRGFFEDLTLHDFINSRLLLIATLTFVAALCASFVFTYLRSKDKNIPVWGSAAKRLLINVAIPMIAGGIYIVRQVQLGNYGLVAPGCLIFYGLALINASKYTLNEIRYLGYLQVILGLINCWVIGYGLYFWAAGFGFLHIIYGVVMWYRYERVSLLNRGEAIKG